MELNIEGLKGCKNGGTDKAKFCQSSYVEIEPNTNTNNTNTSIKAIVCITLGSDTRPKRVADTRALCQHVKDNLKNINIDRY